MPYAYQILDVFTETPLEGNPLAVVFGAGDLTPARMQAIAREFNLSETIFFAEPSDRRHAASARIFTPASELPFAGHPTIGGAIALAAQRGGGEDQLAFELPAGPVMCAVELREGGGRAAFDAPAPAVIEDGVGPSSAIADALGLSPGDLGFGAFEPVRVTCGPRFTIVPVGSLDALPRIALDRGRWIEAFGEMGSAYVIAADGEASFRARMFAPLHNIDEDPATGSAAVAFAALLAQRDSGTNSYTILQGLEMGRPSTLDLTIEAQDGAPIRTRLAGSAVTIAHGTLTL